MGGSLPRLVEEYPLKSLLWVTNLATPYRAPLWSALATRVPLVVALLADSEHNRQWAVPLDEDAFTVLRLRARPVHRTADTTFYAPSARLLREIARRPAAVVLDGWESPAYLSAMVLARLLRVPVYASYRSTTGTHRFHTGPVAWARSWFMKTVTGVLTGGAASTAAVLSLGVPRERIVEGFNTVDVAGFASAAAAARAASGRPPAGHRFLYVGMLIERKNVAALIRAFDRMRSEADTLTIIGSGPLEADLHALVGDLGLAGRVIFRGHLDTAALAAAYGRADTLVLPSTSEVWGLVVNEALAAGLDAVVSRNAGVVPDIEGMPGVHLARPTDVDLAVAMDKSRAGRLGPHENHPVTRHTPENLAAVVARMTGFGDPRP